MFKRDIKRMEQLEDSRSIREGNMVAHQGDALSDTVVFQQDQRTDRIIYRDLYGLDHEQV